MATAGHTPGGHAPEGHVPEGHQPPSAPAGGGDSGDFTQSIVHSLVTNTVKDLES